MQSFLMGFEIVGTGLLWIGGGAAALLLAALAVLICAGLAGAVFDLTTRALAKRWAKTGHMPRSKLGKIILDNHNRLGR